MNSIEQQKGLFNIFKNKLNCSDSILKLFIFISIFYLACCFALLIPFIRNLFILIGEFLAHRQLNHPNWHERLFRYGASGILLYFIFTFVFFFNDDFSRIIADKKPVVFVIAFLFVSVFVIMFRANWVFSDDHEYITTTAINKYTPSYSLGGRFAPLKYIQYNLPLFIFRCLGINTGLPVEVHFMVISSFYCIFVLCLYLLFNRIDPFKNRSNSLFGMFFVCSFFLQASSFSGIFLSLIFPEPQVVMFFSIFMLLYYKALETDYVRYYMAALLTVVYSSYCKEPVFGVFIVIALVNYLFRYNKESKKEKIFNMILIINGAVFLILYYFLSLKHAAGFYNEGRVTISGFRFILSIFKGNPILIIMFLFGFIRLYFIIKKDREHLYYDSLLFAGMAYSFAIVLLHLNRDYYFLPSIVLFLPSLVYWIKYLYQKQYTIALFLFFCLMPIYVYNLGNTIKGIKDTWQHRQEFMPYVVELHSEFNNGKEFIWYESDKMTTDNNYYIAMRKWRKDILNIFINYLNDTEDKDFFLVKKNKDNIGMDENMLFFYPSDNDQWQPMPDELIDILKKNNFELFKDSNGVLIYKHK